MTKLLNLLKTRTFWVNVLGAVLQVVNSMSGEYIPTEAAVLIQMVINLLVRLITKKAV
jgi:uncharacterized membrane protein